MILLTADWHLSSNPRDAYRFRAAELVREVAIEKSVRHMFILGDLTEDRDHHSAAFTNRVVSLLRTFSEQRIRVIIVRGNHDAADPSMPFFRFVSAIEGLSYVTELGVWRVGDHDVAVIPHGTWPAKLPPCDLILTHHTFGGATAETGTQLRGLRLPMRSPPIYSGDVHVPQRQGPVTYVGPPTLIRFGDSYQPRVILLDDDLHASAVRINSPTKRLVEVTANADGQCTWPKQPKIYPGDILKIRVFFEDAFLPPMSHVRANLAEGADRLGATIYSMTQMLDRKSDPVPTHPVSRSDVDLVRQYAATRGYSKPTIDAGLQIVGREA